MTKKKAPTPAPVSSEFPPTPPEPNNPPGPTAPVVACAFDELVPIERLVPNPRNPNQHPESQVRLLAKVIVHQGWRSPVVVSRRSGFIVAGHGRYAAAKVLGVTQVPVDFQDFATEADEWAHLIADNRVAELAETDIAGLRDILAELKGADFDPELAGFDEAALAELLADAAEPTAPEDFPEVDENIPIDHQCPKCGYQWSGKPA